MRNSIKLFFVLLLAVGVSSCMKDNNYQIYDREGKLAHEAPILEKYVQATPGLENAVKDSSGIWYVILNEGVQPEYGTDGKLIDNGYYLYNINSSGFAEYPRISVNYEGKLVANGKVFDEGSTKETADDRLPRANEFIEGWIRAILPKTIKRDGKDIEIGGITKLGLQKGSKIRIVIPSPLAYQDRSTGKIPADSPLDFTLEVLKVMPPLPR